MIYQFKVQLQGFRPPIWRRLQVDPNITFSEFHKILQVAFAWEDYHLHKYWIQKSNGEEVGIEIGKKIEGIQLPVWKEFEDEDDVQLSDFFKKEKDRGLYLYDFGDDWEHEIILEKIVPREEGITYPLCVKAMREAPPEDSRMMFLDGVSPEETMDSKTLTAMINEDLASVGTENITEFDWSTLLQKAKEFNKLAPWKKLGSDDLYAVVDPETGESLFCSILGQAGEVFGLAVYIGEEGLESVLRTLEGETDYQTLQFMQRSILISFEDRNEIDEVDYELIQLAGVPFRGKKQWPVFRSHQPGLFPWLIDEEEARLSLLALEQMIALLKDLEKNTYSMNREQFLARISEVDANDEIEWTTKVLTFSDLGMETLASTQTLDVSEIEIKRLSKYKIDSNIVEFECSYVDMPIQAYEGQRPYFPIMCVAIDHQTGMIVFQEIINGGNLVEECQQVFLKFLENRGTLPKEILVTNQVYTCLIPIAARLRNQITETNYLPGVAEFKELFAQYNSDMM